MEILHGKHTPYPPSLPLRDHGWLRLAQRGDALSGRRQNALAAVGQNPGNRCDIWRKTRPHIPRRATTNVFYTPRGYICLVTRLPSTTRPQNRRQISRICSILCSKPSLFRRQLAGFQQASRVEAGVAKKKAGRLVSHPAKSWLGEPLSANLVRYAVEREIQIQHIHARLANEAECASLDVLRNQLANCVL